MTTDLLRVLDELETPDLWSEIEGRRSSGGRAVAFVPGRRRAITFAVAAAVGIASIFVATSVIGPTPPDLGSLDTSTWRTRHVEPLRMTFRYPPQWHVQPFDEVIGGHAGFTGALVSNISHRFQHPNLGRDEYTSAWDLSGLPDGTIVISIEHLDAIGVPREPNDTRLPLDFARARKLTQNQPGPDWEHLWLPFVLNGQHNGVRAWIGPDSSGHDREIASRIVASIALVAPPTFDGWTIGVSVEHSPSGPLDIEVGPVHGVRRNDAAPWVQHSVILRNTGSETLHFDDTRFSTFLGSNRELLAADKGCGYGSESPGAPVEAGACLLYLDAFSIPPGGSVERPVTLYKDLPGMGPLTEGRYVFRKIYRFSVGASDQKTTVHVLLVYDVRPAS
jgi:hypothetical protein